MPYSIRKSKCKQTDGDPGSYVLSYTDNKGKGHRNCHTSRKKARAQIAAIEMPEGADLDEGWVPFAAMMAQDLEEQLAELAGAHTMVINQDSLRRIVREELISEGVLQVRGTSINEARLQQLVRETLLAEAAITPAHASELGIRFQVHKDERAVSIYAYKDGIDDVPVANLESGSKTVGPCAGAWVIKDSHSRIDGLGPLMYDLMIDVVSPSPLSPDRGLVSRAAKRVWDYYLTRRDDIEAIQLDDLYNTLTPEDEDNCMQVNSTDPHHGEVDWVSSSLSKAYRRKGGGRPTFDELQRLGLIEFK